MEITNAIQSLSTFASLLPQNEPIGMLEQHPDKLYHLSNLKSNKNSHEIRQSAPLSQTSVSVSSRRQSLAEESTLTNQNFNLKDAASSDGRSSILSSEKFDFGTHKPELEETNQKWPSFGHAFFQIKTKMNNEGYILKDSAPFGGTSVQSMGLPALVSKRNQNIEIFGSKSATN